MTTIALQIRDEIISLLSTPAMVGMGTGGVTGRLDYRNDTKMLPFVEVLLLDETASRELIQTTEHTLSIFVRINAGGNDPLLAADPFIVESHARIVADLTLGGLALDVRYKGINRTHDTLDKPVVYADLLFEIDYRTQATSLE